MQRRYIMHSLKENMADILLPAMNPKERHKMMSALLMDMNAFISIELAEKITTLDKTTQYRERKEGHFPKLVSITSQGRRKAYRIRDLKEWMDKQAYSE